MLDIKRRLALPALPVNRHKETSSPLHTHALWYTLFLASSIAIGTSTQRRSDSTLPLSDKYPPRSELLSGHLDMHQDSKSTKEVPQKERSSQHYRQFPQVRYTGNKLTLECFLGRSETRGQVPLLTGRFPIPDRGHALHSLRLRLTRTPFLVEPVVNNQAATLRAAMERSQLASSKVVVAHSSTAWIDAQDAAGW
jgi:hypothetical protein